jgi:hypothetical protein
MLAENQVYYAVIAKYQPPVPLRAPAINCFLAEALHKECIHHLIVGTHGPCIDCFTLFAEMITDELEYFANLN